MLSYNSAFFRSPYLYIGDKNNIQDGMRVSFLYFKYFITTKKMLIQK